MRSKAPLALIEQAIMLLVFSLAAVLCLRAFVWADSQSVQGAARDRAILQAQSAAETLKSCRGDFTAAARLAGGIGDGEQWTVLYDDQWDVTEDMHTYTLRALPCDSGWDNLGAATVEVLDSKGARLAFLTVKWQEVDSHA